VEVQVRCYSCCIYANWCPRRC